MNLIKAERTYWRRLTEIGWLDHVPADELQDLRARIKKALASDDRQSAYLCLGRVDFDSECIEGNRPYATVLSYFAEASRGSFSPTYVREAAADRKGRGRLSFTNKGKRYSAPIQYNCDWVDLAILEPINQAVADAGAKERFIELPPISQLVFIVFVPPEVYDRAVRARLIPTLSDVRL